MSKLEDAARVIAEKWAIECGKEWTFKTGFKEGANWQLKNYPRCETCKHFKPGPFRMECRAIETGSGWLHPANSFGCKIHEEKEK